MFRLILLSALVALACGAPRAIPVRPMLDGRIVGGVATTVQDHPHQISLLYGGSHRCGGSIISPTTVLTAAHCTDGITAGSLSVRYGSSTLNQGGQTVAVSNIRQNPNYDSSTIDSDASVLTLASAIDYTDSQNEIALEASVPSAGTSTVCTGWGATSEGGSLATQLQAVTVPVVSNADCDDAYGAGSITDTMICAGVPQGGLDSCQGDSGGPLRMGDTLVGIVSWGFGCARPGYPGVYASVPAMLSWINQ